MPHQIQRRIIESGSWIEHPKNGVYMCAIVYLASWFSAEINDYDRIFILKASFSLHAVKTDISGVNCTFANVDRRFFRVNQIESIFDLSVI